MKMDVERLLRTANFSRNPSHKENLRLLLFRGTKASPERQSPSPESRTPSPALTRPALPGQSEGDGRKYPASAWDSARTDPSELLEEELEDVAGGVSGDFPTRER